MITLSDNTGKSFEDTIVIKGAKDSEEGIAAEYNYLTDKFGVWNVDWVFIRQSLTPERDKYFDKILIEVMSSKEIEIYFDITSWF
ncbi:MAG: hypothetical protein P9L97_00735 [Candidatus Tenebribacter davisii]|nr:hypothetical protein [Candidatus Tenebribacter davisii]